MRNFSSKSGFSLVETLVVISVISVISGIMLPVLVNSKKAANKTDDMSKLRQLGQAAAMYESQYGEFPLTTRQLVSANMVPAELCATKADLSPSGIGNELIKFTNRRLPSGTQVPLASYKNSFIGLGEFGLAPRVMDIYVLTGPGAGWLVDASESERTAFPTPTQWKGVYRRLTIDGAVIVRKHEDIELIDDKGEKRPGRTPVQLFVDPNPYLMELLKSDAQSPSR
ncbi:MAG TPA: prepilin-type N-terminal cleavage/methylation domain-containing protein [Fimbriimonas sp.]|nr:prepilin-type N-terminal cleavage/methylation domain-containing protein [Fimbriimonas sp.]